MNSLKTIKILHQNRTTAVPISSDNTYENARRLVFCVDPVAVDSYGSTMFGYYGRGIGYIRESYEAGLGEIDFKL